MKIHHLKRRPLSKSNIFYQNFMKLGQFGTRMFSSSFRMAYIASCLQELLPSVNDNSLQIYTNLAIAGAFVSYGHISSLIYKSME